MLIITILKVYGYVSFFCHFTKGNYFCDFLLASLVDIAFPIQGHLLLERICSLQELTSTGKGGLNKNVRVASLESVSIRFNTPQGLTVIFTRETTYTEKLLFPQ